MPTTITVLDSASVTQTVNTLPALGKVADASSLPVALSTEGYSALTQLHTDMIAATPAGTNTIGAMVPIPRATANGTTSSRVVASASSNTSTSLKASAGNIARVDLFNVAAYDVFVKFYNKASAPTVGTDTPVWTMPLKAGTGYSSDFLYGKSFATGIAYAITKLVADADTTALVAGDVTGSIDWI